MIQPLQLNTNINFKSQLLDKMTEAQTAMKEASVSKQETKDEVVLEDKKEEAKAQQVEEKKSSNIKDKYNDVKKTVTNALKVFNGVTGVGAGVARGIVDGAVATAAVGVIAKSAAKAEKYNVFQIAGNIIKDTAKGVWNTVKYIPSIITKSPLENIKTVTSLPKKFFAEQYLNAKNEIKAGYLKGHKGIKFAAGAIGVGILAFRTIQGKINANKTNAGLDHATNQGHIK